MKFVIKNAQLRSFNEYQAISLPKYTSQIINLANQNAQGTRPRNVGQMSELFPDYLEESNAPDIDSWREWYTERYPNSIEVATDKIYQQILKLQDAIQLIDYQLVRSWVEDFLISKTFTGLYVQKAILAYLAEMRNESYTLANPAQEAAGIDGFVGNIAYSIKPSTYKTVEGLLPEEINTKMIYYEKTSSGLLIEVDE